MFMVCQNPDLITPRKNSIFGALVRHHKVGSLGERRKKKKKPLEAEADNAGGQHLHWKGRREPVHEGRGPPRGGEWFVRE